MQRYTRKRKAKHGYCQAGCGSNYGKTKISKEWVAASYFHPGSTCLRSMFICSACAFHGGPDPASVGGSGLFPTSVSQNGNFNPPYSGHLNGNTMGYLMSINRLMEWCAPISIHRQPMKNQQCQLVQS